MSLSTVHSVDNYSGYDYRVLLYCHIDTDYWFHNDKVCGYCFTQDSRHKIIITIL